eukprot:gene4293-23138_t
MGWGWIRPHELRCGAAGPLLDLAAAPERKVAHAVREGARRAEWRRAAERRNAGYRADVQGIERGIDREATWALMQRAKLDPYDLGIVRAIVCAGAWTRQSLQACQVVEDSTCPWCDSGEEETARHRRWRCAAWAAVRARHPVATAAYREDWPNCLACCGIMPEGLEPPPPAPAAASISVPATWTRTAATHQTGMPARFDLAIASSRAATRRSAGVCTRPALRQRRAGRAAARIADRSRRADRGAHRPAPAAPREDTGDGWCD